MSSDVSVNTTTVALSAVHTSIAVGVGHTLVEGPTLLGVSLYRIVDLSRKTIQLAVWAVCRTYTVYYKMIYETISRIHAVN